MDKNMKDNLKMDIEMELEVTIVQQVQYYIKVTGKTTILYNNDFIMFFII